MQVFDYFGIDFTGLSDYYSSKELFWETWISTPILCWGFGPFLILNVSFYTVALMSELLLSFNMVTLVSYKTNRNIEEKAIHRTQLLNKEPSMTTQLWESLWNSAGPVAIANTCGLAVVMSYNVPGPYPLLPELDLFHCAIEVLKMFIVADFFIYWTHRLLHESTFLWKFHAVHHTIGAPRPVSTGFIHPIDATFQEGLPVILASMMFQPHPLVFYIFLVLHYSEKVFVHSGIDSLWINLTFRMGWLPFRADAGHHVRHHEYCNHAKKATNYAESFMLWDWAFGTLNQTKNAQELKSN